MARYKAFQLSQETVREVIAIAEDFDRFAKGFKYAMDGAVAMYAFVTLAEAQRRSRGPLDPRQTGRRLSGHRFVGDPHGNVRREPLYDPTAWKIPVRRITGEYFAGWRAERLNLGVWMVTNYSREAYFIEHGINHRGTGLVDSGGNRVRIRRPILKLSVLAAINFIEGRNADTVALKGLFQPYHSERLFKNPSADARLGGQLANNALSSFNPKWWSEGGTLTVESP